MKFPKATSEFGGYYVIAGAAANGGGSSVNQRLLAAASTIGFTLKSSQTLNSPNWQTVPGVVNNSVTLPAGTNSQFFALFHLR